MESVGNLFCLIDFLSERHDTLWQHCGETEPWSLLRSRICWSSFII